MFFALKARLNLPNLSAGIQMGADTFGTLYVRECVCVGRGGGECVCTFVLLGMCAAHKALCT